ncbi:unnamed protein product [Brachionus calyciflorus]|uniref:ZSWIM1/3 RNaseH-like domain-containing protein n=1 Tax=Brachionus calyciflorus TaxID=104777 RepID=A0A814BZA1_9BILA|nr:unnamed protein product [Brachionus calyciflorus]
MNVENYLLYVILVQDNNFSGRPVANCLMKNETNENLEFFYSTFVKHNNVEFVKLVMVDKDLTNLNFFEFFSEFNNSIVRFPCRKILKDSNNSPISNLSDYRENLLNGFRVINEESNDNTLSIADQTDFNLSPEIKVNRIVNRVG